MIVTKLTEQKRDAGRVNVFVDGKYRLSLRLEQVVELGVRVGLEMDELELERWEETSEFGKVYQRVLEYCLVRPRSVREMEEYLWKKRLDKKLVDGGVKKGVSERMTEEVLEKLVDGGYVDDEKFTEFWVENRMRRKGVSGRRLRMELAKKGVDVKVVESVLARSERDEKEEMRKMIVRKRAKYDDEKLVVYLVRQGFGWNEAKEAVEEYAKGDN
ncbi:RecX family transcriptional regulator [Candidatus Saccharibacteria bacterium]|nr:RecX family transcriptional regulator [Candidatus Saccharibacteria bacterium]